MHMTFNCFVLHYYKNVERLNYLRSALKEVPFFEVVSRYDREAIEPMLSELYTASDARGQERVNAMADVLHFNQALVGNRLHKQGLGREPAALYAEIRARMQDGSLPAIPYTAPSINNISLQLKHFEAWRISCDRPFPYTLVLEDDVILKEDSLARLQQLMQELRILNVDYIDLAGGSNLFPQGVFRDMGHALYHIDPPSTRTTCAYLISQKFCQKLVAQGMDVLQPVDVDLTYFFRKFDANVFWIDPPLFVHGSEHGYYQTSIAR